MRKGLAIALILILTLSLAGCKAAATAEAAATSSATPAALPGRQTNNVMSLIMGTLQLDGTENAVDAAQAAELLPLWKAYRALLKSDATAPAELTALVEQIRDSMTPEQILAMEGATLGPEEQSALAARFGVEMPAFGGGAGALAAGELTDEELAARKAQIESRIAEGGGTGPVFEGRARGEAGAGMGPGGAAGVIVGGGGFEPPAGFQAGAGDNSTGRAGASTWMASLVDAVITYLEGVQ